MRRPCLIAACLLASSAGCAGHISLASGVASGEEVTYVAWHDETVSMLERRGGRLIATRLIATPCASNLDIEFHRGELVVICANGLVFSTDVSSATAELVWRNHGLEPTAPHFSSTYSLQRADGAVERIGVKMLSPHMPASGLVASGPAQDDIDATSIRGPSDLWIRSWGVASANESGDAFAFAVYLSDRWQLSLSSARHGNVVCSAANARRSYGLRDVSVDAEGRHFAALTDAAVYVIDIGGRLPKVEAFGLTNERAVSSTLRCRR